MCITSRFTVGFHNFNLRIFNLRVLNPNKLIVDVFLTRCRISKCQGLGPKKHDEISEIDRTHVGSGDDTVGNPHRARISQFELFELVLLSKLDKQLPVQQLEATVSQSTVPSPP